MRSKHHNINPSLANLSHVVNHLSFGPVLPRNHARALEAIPNEYFDMKSTTPMDDKHYTNNKLHQAFHHYIKVVSTTLTQNTRRRKRDPILAYQMVQSSQIMQVGVVPIYWNLSTLIYC